jgi:hypothetical protein
MQLFSKRARKMNGGLFLEIKDECYLWSIPGRGVIKPLTVANLPIM